MIEQLYKKKIIRDFLSLFIENKWKALIASILEYGIIKFKKNYSNFSSLTADDILNLVEDVKKSENKDKVKEDSFLETRILSCKSNTSKKDKETSVSKLMSKDKKIKKTTSTSISKRSETPVKHSKFYK